MDQLSVDDALDRIGTMDHLFKLLMERRLHRPSGEPTRLQRFLLSVIAKDGAMPMASIVAALEVGPATASELVSVLEDRGWVERVISSQDRRRHLVQITADGQQVVARAKEDRQRRLRAILTELTAEQRYQLVTLATRIATILTEQNPEPAKEDHRP